MGSKNFFEENDSNMKNPTFAVAEELFGTENVSADKKAFGGCETSKKKFFTKYDFWVIAFLLAALVFSIFMLAADSTEDELVAVVRVKGKIYREIPLAQVEEPYELTIKGEEAVVLRISSGGVGFVSSGCPDKLCVNTGELIKSGQSAVCLPARVSVKLVSDTDGVGKAPDAVAG